VSKKIFKEEQSFQGKDVIVLTSAIGLILAITFYQQVFIEQDYSLWSSGALLLTITGLATWTWSLFQRKLETSISNKKITCKVHSWFSRKQQIKLDEIASCSVVETPLAAQLHGSNITVNGEKMFSFTGRNGLAIETRDGQRYFVGSNRVDEMEKAIIHALAE
jgi:hypothetical protein